MSLIETVCGAVLLIFCCAVLGRPQDNSLGASSQKTTGNVTLVKNEVLPLDVGKASYSYDIELSDGTKLIQTGRTEPPSMGENQSSLVVEGSYAYLAPDGKQITVTYVADKNGFHPILKGGSNGNGAEISVPVMSSKK